MSDERTTRAMRAALEASHPGWRRHLTGSPSDSVQHFVARITARLVLLSAGELLYVESAVEEQPDHAVAVEIRAFTPTAFVQVAGAVDPAGKGEIAFSTASPRSAVTRVALRDVRMGPSGEPAGVMFDLTFANGEVATIGGGNRYDKGDADGLTVLRTSLLGLGRHG